MTTPGHSLTINVTMCNNTKFYSRHMASLGHNRLKPRWCIMHVYWLYEKGNNKSFMTVLFRYGLGGWQLRKQRVSLASDVRVGNWSLLQYN